MYNNMAKFVLDSHLYSLTLHRSNRADILKNTHRTNQTKKKKKKPYKC